MKVVKRDGKKESVQLSKIQTRIRNLKNKDKDNPLQVDDIIVASKTASGLYDGVTTRELDSLAAEVAASMIIKHPDYNKLAAYIEVSSLHKETETFDKNISKLYDTGIISKEFFEYCSSNMEDLIKIVDYERDYLFDYFGLKTLKKSYLLKDEKGNIVERPQDMWLRVAAFINQGDLKRTKETYDLLSLKYFTHATPTLFNSGTTRPQLSSCFLMDIHEDSIDGIYKSLADCAKISQSAGGIGLSIHKIRSKGSYISGTNGFSNGITPMLRVFDSTARYVDQCFHPGTRVYTKGGLKPINEIFVGDEVLTKGGTFEEVLEIKQFPKSNSKNYSLKLKHQIDDVIVSADHPLLTISNQKKGLNYSVIKNRLDKGLASVDWKSVKDLSEDDLVGFPIPKYEKDIKGISIDDCRFYGLLVGDGNISYDNNTFYVSFNSETNKESIEWTKNYLKERNVSFKEDVCGEKNVRIRGSLNSNIIFNHKSLYTSIRRSLKEEKNIDEKFLHLPKEKLLSLIKGIFDSDGHIGEKELLIEMTSEKVINSLKYIFLRLGILTSGIRKNRLDTDSFIAHKLESVTLRIPKVKIITDLLGCQEGEYVNQFTYKNYIFSRVQGIDTCPYKGKVYDLRIDNDSSYVTECGTAHNGGGKRKGSIAIYLEPWHKDIFEFLDLKKNHGKEEMRARDLFYAMWIPDLFMQRVKDDGYWTLFDPKECGGLFESYGEEFKRRYVHCERNNTSGKRVAARDLWNKIIESQIETGTPYMLYKDACNLKSNQKNLGTIKSSNLCSEILEYTDKDEHAVCNLASISLGMFVSSGGVFDYKRLYEVSRHVTRNLDNVIDINYYPTREAERSNKARRPVGLGVQGLADVFMKMKLPFTSDEAKLVNKRIFETIYKGAIDESIQLAKEKGTYEGYEESPASMGLLQFDLWGIDANCLYHDWSETKSELSNYGLRNSLVVALMPTASTAQILGNTESFEPVTSNIYVRRVLSGEFLVVNKYLVNDLIELGLWTDKIINKIKLNRGSIQNIEEIPQGIKDIYKTVWEIKMKDYIDMSADRGAFVCQSQSLNLYLESPSKSKLTSMHLYAWEKGLKTGMYYLRTRPATNAIQFTTSKEDETLSTKVDEELAAACSLDDPDCISCSA